ncbi:MAG: 1-hydroxycarotenoid 3,4-desaturase CrtD [Bacteroidota bacterium]
MHAVIIGSGIAGIACSIRLALQGWQVAVYEANSTPGGKLATFSQGGFRFDQGPSLFTMPDLVDELFVLAGKNPRNYYQYQRLPIACRYFYEDKTVLTAYADLQKLTQEITEKLDVDAAVVENYLARSAKLFDLIRKSFLERSLHRWATYCSRDTLKLLAHLFQLPLIGSLHRTNRLQLEHPKLVQLFDRFATYTGSSPYRASGMLQVVAHLEHNAGAFFPDGGMYTLVRCLVKLAEELGVQYSYNTRVEEIVLEGRQVKGVRTNATTIPADVVVSNMDIANTYQHLLPSIKTPQRVIRQERSSAALIFYWGVKGTFEQLSLHNIFFSADYRQEFSEIFEGKTVPQDPTVYVNITAKEQPSDAPAGQENWFVMINVPANQGQDWERLIAQARNQVLDKLRRMLGKDIEPLIEHERIWDPRGIEKDTLAYQGALYGASANQKLATFLRHPNISRTLQGLYFCGGTVHPGGGIPLCLLSAKIVADLIASGNYQ